MAYEKTAVPVSRSQEGIRKLLLQNRATGVAFVSQTDPLSEGFEAMVPIGDKNYRIRIVAHVRKSDKGNYTRQETEYRRIWRVLFYHLKALYEAATSGVIEFRELILPYVVVCDGRTIAEHLLPQLDKAIEGRPARLLGGKVIADE